MGLRLGDILLAVHVVLQLLKVVAETHCDWWLFDVLNKVCYMAWCRATSLFLPPWEEGRLRVLYTRSSLPSSPAPLHARPLYLSSAAAFEDETGPSRAIAWIDIDSSGWPPPATDPVGVGAGPKCRRMRTSPSGWAELAGGAVGGAVSPRNVKRGSGVSEGFSRPAHYRAPLSLLGPDRLGTDHRIDTAGKDLPHWRAFDVRSCLMRCPLISVTRGPGLRKCLGETRQHETASQFGRIAATLIGTLPRDPLDLSPLYRTACGPFCPSFEAVSPRPPPPPYPRMCRAREIAELEPEVERQGERERERGQTGCVALLSANWFQPVTASAAALRAAGLALDTLAHVPRRRL